MQADGLILGDESYRILGACFEVYKDKGCGFLEAVYHECLALQFADMGIPFVEKPRLRLTYKGRTLRQEYEPDFFCYSSVIIEIKAVKTLLDEHRAQAINYLRATDTTLALLVNFGHHPGIQHERFVDSRPPLPSLRDP